jgi:hypothetical protein
MRAQVARATSREVVGEPPDCGGHGRVLDDEVSGSFEAMRLSLRKSSLEIA